MSDPKTPADPPPADPPPAGHSSSAATCEARLEKLTVQSSERAKSRRRRTMLTLIGGSILAVASSFSMMALAKMAQQLDARALAEIGRSQLQMHLPSARRQIQDHLEAEAPRLVARVLHGMLDMLPRLRRGMMAELNAKLMGLNAEFERRCVQQMRAAIQRSKAELDAKFPELGARDKLERLVETVAEQFKISTAFSTDQLYPHYKVEMGKIQMYLSDLKSRAYGDLTEEERTRRKMIQTLLQLVKRERKKPG